MRDPLRNLLAGLVSVALLVVAPTVGRAQDSDKTFEYIVQTGDSCQRISEKIYGDKDRWELVHMFTDMGPMPHHLVAGEVLVLPVPPGYRADAEVSRTHGPVNARPPRKKDWSKATRGLELWRSWRVNSLEEASAEITFRDTTALQMRENTIVVIYGATWTKARKQQMEAELESGALKSRLGELAGGGSGGGEDLEVGPPLIVSTPSAEVSLSGSETLLEADPDGMTRVANHKGKAVQVSGRKGKASVAVKVGYGTRVAPKADPEPPRPLPPAPAWGQGATTFLTLDDAGTLTGSWGAVAEAQRFRIEIADSPRGGVVQVIEVPSTVVAFEAQGLPVGRYYVTLASVDGDKFESPPSEQRIFDLVHLAAQGSVRMIDGTPTVARGATLAAPAGYKCAVGDAPASATLTFLQAGPVRVACYGEGGASGPLALRVDDAAIELFGPMGAELAMLKIAHPTVVTLTVADPASLAGTLEVVAGDGVEVSAMREASPGHYEVTLTPTVDAISPTTLVAQTRSAAGVVELGRWQVPIAGAPEVASAGKEWVTFGAFLDYGILNDEVGLEDFGLTSMWRVGLDLGVNATDWLSLEGEFLFGRPIRPGARDGIALYSGRGQAVFSLLDGLVRPLLVLGGGAEVIPASDATTPIAFVGAGVKVRGDGAVGFRALVLQDVAFRDSVGVPLTELRLGFTVDL